MELGCKNPTVVYFFLVLVYRKRTDDSQVVAQRLLATAYEAFKILSDLYQKFMEEIFNHSPDLIHRIQ